MDAQNVSRSDGDGLPPALVTAQEAINLPEVQEMLRKLSQYNLGIFMPHMHEEKTGRFQALPPKTVQVEAGLQVSFRSESEIAQDRENFLPVGWVWCKEKQGITESATCVVICKRSPDGGHTNYHGIIDDRD